MDDMNTIFIIFLALCIMGCCLCTDECCCELCMNHNQHTVDVLSNELNEVSKVSSPIQESAKSTHVEV